MHRHFNNDGLRRKVISSHKIQGNGMCGSAKMNKETKLNTLLIISPSPLLQNLKKK